MTCDSVIVVADAPRHEAPQGGVTGPGGVPSITYEGGECFWPHALRGVWRLKAHACLLMDKFLVGWVFKKTDRLFASSMRQ